MAVNTCPALSRFFLDRPGQTLTDIDNYMYAQLIKTRDLDFHVIFEFDFAGHFESGECAIPATEGLL